MIITCIHAQSGLCPDCQASYDDDPTAYVEYGDYPEGLERWRQLREQLRLDALAHRAEHAAHERGDS